MKAGKVIGTVVATRKDEKLVGFKLMMIQPLNAKLEPIGESLIAVDTMGAGIGEIVMYSRGTAARNAVRKSDSPLDVAIVGIIDDITIQS